MRTTIVLIVLLVIVLAALLVYLGFTYQFKDGKITKRALNRKQVETKNAYLFMSPYLLLFFVCIVAPIIIAILLSFTSFNGVNKPNFLFIDNFIYLFTKDKNFLKLLVKF